MGTAEFQAGANGRILLVDDDAELGELTAKYLTNRGFTVEVEMDGARGLERATKDKFTALVLDVMLPGLNGLEVLRRLRAHPETAHLPIVMLTAHGDETDRIVGLELGADDYLPKPFNPRELLARINAVLRRNRLILPDIPVVEAPPAEKPHPTLKHFDLEMHLAARAVTCGGREVELTAVEFDLLHALLRSPGSVVGRDELAREVLHRKLLPLDRSLDIHVSRLRGKLWPEGGGLERIKTIRGVGYLLANKRENP
jgi:two-component system response regulator CpxR